MVVKYMWQTERYLSFTKTKAIKKTTYWRGWFLLGFIPVYIETYNFHKTTETKG